jgi:hypothetical protein
LRTGFAALAFSAALTTLALCPGWPLLTALTTRPDCTVITTLTIFQLLQSCLDHVAHLSAQLHRFDFQLCDDSQRIRLRFPELRQQTIPLALPIRALFSDCPTKRFTNRVMQIFKKRSRA